MRSTDVEPKPDADQAVAQLYAAHYRPLIRLAVLLVRDVATAEEVVQDAFVAIHDAWPRLRDTDQALAYLRRNVVNTSRSVRRAVPDPPEPDATLAALRGLPDRQREAILLRYYADLAEAEVAAAMGISLGAVKAHIARGMAALRTALDHGHG